ncbi:MAG: hypothetical protein AAGJ80_00050 [Cyanobacteria bacterium J06553_1]
MQSIQPENRNVPLVAVLTPIENDGGFQYHYLHSESGKFIPGDGYESESDAIAAALELVDYSAKDHAVKRIIEICQNHGLTLGDLARGFGAAIPEGTRAANNAETLADELSNDA